MSDSSAIQWTDATWNPVVGCARVSAGCDNCYAVGMTRRLEGMSKAGPQPGKSRTAQYRGLTVVNRRGNSHFNGIVRTVPDALTTPLQWRKPRRVFVNSMSDLFHREVPFEFIDKVFAIMALCPQHTFQVLTKRPERMAQYMTRREVSVGWAPTRNSSDEAFKWKTPCDRVYREVHHSQYAARIVERGLLWPLPNVWLGASVENQATADERIPHLLNCPAAVRFLSCEPLLDAIDLPDTFLLPQFAVDGARHVPHWVIVGGESGPRARPCYVDYIEAIIDQCRAAGVPCFVKQLGRDARIEDASHPHGWPTADGPVNWETGCIRLRDAKGGDPGEWPAHLRVREWPQMSSEVQA